jgi:hypothetical protein
MKSLFVIVFLCITHLTVPAQQKYNHVDKYVAALGSLDSLNVASIAEQLTQPFGSKEEKSRAVFYWIAHHIKPDLKGMRTNDNRKSKPETVILNRTATAVGYANLFQEMLSLADIRCLTVDGYVKRFEDDINNPVDPNHTWNVVQLGNSPSQWFYVDVTMAAGYIDKRFSVFTPNFVSQYFFCNTAVFNLQHFPDNDAWMIGDGPSSIKHFYNLPVLQQHGVALGAYQPLPSTGFFKTKMKNPVNFSFLYSGDAPETIEMVYGEGRRQTKENVIFSAQNGQISFRFYFLKDGEYPVRILADGKPVLEWQGEVVE